MQKNSFDSFRAPEMSFNGTKTDKRIVNIFNEHAVTNWDDKIPFSYQKTNDRPHRPRFRHFPKIICKTGVLGKPTRKKQHANKPE